MNHKEGIEIIKNFPEWNLDDLWLYEDDMEELTNMAISAMEKQIPKKIIHIGFNPVIGTKLGICQNCDDEVLKECDFCYCPKCGQKLDWSDDNRGVNGQ